MAKDRSSWWAFPLWVSGVALGLALSVLPRTAKLVVLHVISNEKENLRAEVDAADLQPDAQPTNRRNRSKSYKPGTDNTRKN